MSATVRSDWFWSDWLGDQAVRRLTPAERGVWIDLIGLAAVSNPVGYVCDEMGRPLTHEEIARVTNAGSPVEVAELIKGIVDKGAASRDRAGRLFNRRMVRETEKEAKRAALAAKRAKAGRSGAERTNSKYFGLQRNPGLPQQLMQQLPGHVPRQSLESTSKENKKITSVLGTARAGHGETVEEKNIPAGSLATAPLDSALASQPSAEQDQQGATERRPPHLVSRAELEAAFAARHSKGTH